MKCSEKTESGNPHQSEETVLTESEKPGNLVRVPMLFECSRC